MRARRLDLDDAEPVDRARRPGAGRACPGARRATAREGPGAAQIAAVEEGQRRARRSADHRSRPAAFDDARANSKGVDLADSA